MANTRTQNADKRVFVYAGDKTLKVVIPFTDKQAATALEAHGKDGAEYRKIRNAILDYQAHKTAVCRLINGMHTNQFSGAVSHVQNVLIPLMKTAKMDVTNPKFKVEYLNGKDVYKTVEFDWKAIVRKVELMKAFQITTTDKAPARTTVLEEVESIPLGDYIS